jgi:hypothetical protein
VCVTLSDHTAAFYSRELPYGFVREPTFVVNLQKINERLAGPPPLQPPARQVPLPLNLVLQVSPPCPRSPSSDSVNAGTDTVDYAVEPESPIWEDDEIDQPQVDDAFCNSID